jgi:hypothetical protein
MVASQRGMKGGHLVVPKYGIAFGFSKPALIMFDGQSLLHGVLPMEKQTKNAYRYSVVYYALQQMCHCLSPAEELARIRTIKTDREQRRGKMPKGDK